MFQGVFVNLADDLALINVDQNILILLVLELIIRE